MEAFEVLRGRRKTILELRRDTILFPDHIFDVIIMKFNSLSNFLEKLALLYNMIYLYPKPTQVGG